MLEADYLYKPFNRFTPTEISFLGKSKRLFEPILRPFRVQRVDRQFDIKRTIKYACGHEDIMAQFKYTQVPTRNSKLVIAVSLNGIDRCACVAILPLLGQLRELLDIPIYIYTTDVTKAELIKGNLVNSADIGWNHVIAPYVFNKLATIMSTQHKNAKLLIIDSLGNTECPWHTSWTSWDESQLLRELNTYDTAELAALREYVKHNGKTNWQAGCSKAMATTINKWVTKNVTRFIDTPALEEHVIDWVLNPTFTKFTENINRYRTDYATAIANLRTKVREIHLLSTREVSSTYTLTALKRQLLDYYHEANTLDGFSKVLTNIYHGRCTHRLSKHTANFGIFQATQEEIPGYIPQEEELQLDKKSKQALNLTPIAKWLPQEYWEHKHVNPQTKEQGIKQVYFSTYEPELESTLIRKMTTAMLQDIPLEELTDANTSNYSKVQIMRAVLNRLQTRMLVSNKQTTKDTNIQFHHAPTDQRVLHPKALQSHELWPHLGQHLESVYSLLSPHYNKYLEALPLAQLSLAPRAHFIPAYLAMCATPSALDVTIYHEMGHYFEHAIPLIGVYAIRDLKLRGNTENLSSLEVTVHNGDKSYTLINPYINRYSSKVYKAATRHLPIATEVFSTHLEYFTSPETLISLYTKDEEAFTLMVFLLIGGPQVVLDNYIHYRSVAAQSGLNHAKTKTYSGGWSYRRVTSKTRGFGL